MSIDEQLAAAFREVERLRQALANCAAARETAERELTRNAAASESATEEMQHFIYAVSHDLRQPLRTILSFAQLLGRHPAADKETRELTASIVEGASDMNTLIEDLLRYSRINNSPIRTTVGLNSVVQWAWLNLQSLARETGAQLMAGDLPELAIEESQFVQLFQELFTNSLRFRTAEPPTIEVSAEEEGDGYTISVRDNGRGIDPKYHETVFAPLKRLHGREVPGTGLGLAICRKIVRAHGGRIWVESDGQHGAAFRFTVPF